MLTGSGSMGAALEANGGKINVLALVLADLGTAIALTSLKPRSPMFTGLQEAWIVMATTE